MANIAEGDQMTNDKDKVSATNPVYDALETKREVFRAVRSTDSIRERSTSLLPKYPAEQQGEYDARLKAATIDGLVTGGVEMLTGAVFQGEIDTSGVTVDAAVLENFDNQGNHFDVFARDAFEKSFEGCAVILVDSPQASVTDAEQERVLGIRPYAVLYDAGNVINWRYEVNPISKAKELVLIVFKELTSEAAGRFVSGDVTRYRAYFLTSSIVSWELWRETNDNGKKELILEQQGTIPALDAIPVAVVGCLDDEPKLLVESRLEIKAYQKESSFDTIEYLSIPTFYTIGYEGDEPLALGASTHIKLPAQTGNEGVGYAQIDASGHESLKGTIQAIKEYIKGRLNFIYSNALNPANDKTATQTVIEDRDKQARLVKWAEQLKDALELALGFIAQMQGKGKDAGGEIVLNTAWSIAKAQAEAMQASLAGDNDQGQAGDSAMVN